MLRVIDKVRTKYAVHWSRSDKTDRYGQHTYSAPTETMVKWTHGTFEVQSESGTTITVGIKVLIGVQMKVGDYLMLGRLTDVVDQTIPKNNPGAYLVKQYTEQTTHSGTQEVRHAYL